MDVQQLCLARKMATINEMTGSLAQVIALTAFGNDYLKNGHIPKYFINKNTTFQFCNKVEFGERKKIFFIKLREIVVANNPVEWFKFLKSDGCKHLKLYFEYSKDQSFAEDHKLAGLIGGGGSWLIEAVYDNYSNYWANKWEVTNLNAADRNIWKVNYGIAVRNQHISNLQIDNKEIKNTLRRTLMEISDFAFKQNLQSWGQQFEKARSTLDSLIPEENYYHNDLIPIDNYSLLAKQIIFSAGSAWVFGGMGSWNDLGFHKKEDNEAYNRLSKQLYSNINQALIAGVNTY